jgi:flagella basal body P-ring formation protein FlgA
MNPRAFSLVLAFALVAPAARADLPAARVALRASALVSRPDVTLGAVATLEGSDAITSALEGLVVARAPRAGYTEHLSMAELQRAVRTRYPEWGGRIAWSGAPAVDVEVVVQRVTGERLQRAAEDQARQALAGRYESVTVQAVEVVPELTVPAGEVRLAPRPLPLDRAPANRELVWIDVFVDGAMQRAVAVPVRVDAYASARVARVDLAAGAELRAEDFETTPVDAAHANGRLASPTAPLAGERLRRSLHRGAPLLAADVEDRPAVSRGEAVTLHLDDAAVHLEARVTALSDAAVGQSLWVRRGASGQPLRARVVSPGNVEVASQ